MVQSWIPLDIFDLRYRANRRNLNLLKEHYEEGRHKGSAWGIIIFILLALLVMVLLSIYVVYKLFQWGWAQLMGWSHSLPSFFLPFTFLSSYLKKPYNPQYSL